jgi:hypothetical protein
MNGRRKMGFLPKLALPQKGRQILMDRVKGFFAPQLQRVRGRLCGAPQSPNGCPYFKTPEAM